MKRLNIRRLHFDRGPHSDVEHVTYIDSKKCDIIVLFMSLEFNPVQIINSIINDGLVCPDYYSLMPLDEKFLCETFFIYAYNIEELRLLMFLLFFEKVNNIYGKYFIPDVTHFEGLLDIFNTYIRQADDAITILEEYRQTRDTRFRIFSMYVNNQMTAFIKGYMSGYYRTLYGTSIGEIDNEFIESIICEIPKD